MSSIKRDVVNEVHAPARRNFGRRRVIIKGIRDLFQIDLVEMIPYAKENDNFKYIFVCINTFSKFAWAIPIKNKTSKEVSEAMKSILASGKKNVPINMQSDQGKEFFNTQFKKIMDNYNINHYSTFSNLKSSIVERFNRTLKNKMWKEFSFNGNYRWVDMLQQLVNDYNNTVHRTTKYKPVAVNERNAKTIQIRAYNNIKVADPRIAKFGVGDHVRISKHRHVFSKMYTPNWTNEIFTISKIQNTYPRTYVLQDSQKQNVLGGFYEEELKKVQHPDVYLVEKVLRRRKNDVFVKWLGMPSSHNSWISKDNVL